MKESLLLRANTLYLVLIDVFAGFISIFVGKSFILAAPRSGSLGQRSARRRGECWSWYNILGGHHGGDGGDGDGCDDGDGGDDGDVGDGADDGDVGDCGIDGDVGDGDDGSDAGDGSGGYIGCMSCNYTPRPLSAHHQVLNPHLTKGHHPGLTASSLFVCLSKIQSFSLSVCLSIRLVCLCIRLSVMESHTRP